MSVKEYFKGLTCLNNASQAFIDQAEKFNDLNLYLQSHLEEIKEERALLSELRQKMKSLPHRGVGSRNGDFSNMSRTFARCPVAPSALRRVSIVAI